MIIDTYKTIKSPSSGIFKEKGSKFFSFAYPITNEEEFKEIQKTINKQYHDARHRCFAFSLGIENYIRANDDGEPSNSAGKPILGQIQSKGLTNILIYVVRYFGGTLLGVGGLIQAYKESAANAINNAEIIEKTIDNIFKVSFLYKSMNEIMKLIKDENLYQFDQNFGEKCELKIKIRKKNTENILKKLNKVENIKTEFLKTI